MRFTRPEKCFEVKEANEQKISSRAISEPERKIVGLSRKLFDMLVKFALYFSTGSIWRKPVYFKVWLSLFFADFEQRKFSLFAKSFGSGVKTAFYVFRERVWGNMFFLEMEVCFKVFGPWAEKLGPPVEYPLTTLFKLYITSPEKRTKQDFRSKLCFFNASRRLSQRILAV